MANDHSGFRAGRRGSDVADLKGDPGGRDGIAAVSALLQSPRRRAVLAVLDESADPTLDRTALAASVAAASPDGATADDRLERRVEISLHHKHLPALEAAGVLEYDPETGMVRYDPDPELLSRVRAVLD